MKYLLLWVHVVVKTLNLEVPHCRLAVYAKELYSSAYRTCSTTVFPHLTNLKLPRSAGPTHIRFNKNNNNNNNDEMIYEIHHILN